MIPHIKTDEGLTAVINGSVYQLRSDNPSYAQVWDAIENEERNEVIIDLFNAANAIKRYLKDNVEIDGGIIRFRGVEVHNLVVDRILEFMADGYKYEPLVKFLERLLANPSRRSIEELYKFLEHKALPITEDGCFLAYKGVRSDYMDIHSGRFSNAVGKVNAMPRNQVDDNFRNGCSVGFHVGSLEYASDWGRNGRVVIVKVDPADVVSVPEDCSFQKLRTSKYEVVADFHGALTRPLHSGSRPYDDESRYEPEPFDLDEWPEYDY